MNKQGAEVCWSLFEVYDLSQGKHKQPKTFSFA